MVLSARNSKIPDAFNGLIEISGRILNAIFTPKSQETPSQSAQDAFKKYSAIINAIFQRENSNEIIINVYNCSRI